VHAGSSQKPVCKNLEPDHRHFERCRVCFTPGYDEGNAVLYTSESTMKKRVRCAHALQRGEGERGSQGMNGGRRKGIVEVCGFCGFVGWIGASERARKEGLVAFIYKVV
jgi:hypothetical protein